MAIYTHDMACQIAEYFEDILSANEISVPSPEDDERGEDNMIGLYGSVYSELLDNIEYFLLNLLVDAGATEQIVAYEFSGSI